MVSQKYSGSCSVYTGDGSYTPTSGFCEKKPEVWDASLNTLFDVNHHCTEEYNFNSVYRTCAALENCEVSNSQCPSVVTPSK